MNAGKSKAIGFETRNRFHFALEWATILVIPGWMDLLFGYPDLQRLAVRQTLWFSIVFLITATVVWTLRERQRRTGIPISSMALGLIYFTLVYPFAWSANRLSHESSIRFRGETSTTAFTRAEDPFLFWLFPGMFALLAVVMLIGGVRRAASVIRHFRYPTSQPQ